MKIKLFYVAMVLILCSAVIFSQEVQFSQNPLAGQKLFIEKGCVNCHAVKGQGAKVGSDLGRTQSGRGPAGIVSMMWNHAPDMSQVMEKSVTMAKLSGEELANLIAFLYFINYLDEPGDADQGKKLVREKACRTCHRIGDEGGKTGPALDKMKDYASPIFLAQAMWNHGPGMSAAAQNFSITRPVFQGKEIADILAYFRSVNTTDINETTYMVPGNPQIGKQLFESKKCSLCHIPNKEGYSVGPDLSKQKLNVGVSEVAASMLNHGPKMWSKMKELNIQRPKFQENEMADLISYLYFLGFVEPSGDMENGKRLFSGKQCVECHSIRGQGGNVGPDLAQSKNLSHFFDAAAAMWNHGNHMRQLMQKTKIPIPRFSETEMTDLLFYLRSQKVEE